MESGKLSFQVLPPFSEVFQFFVISPSTYGWTVILTGPGADQPDNWRTNTGQIQDKTAL